jgi:hypothetical protein
LFRINHLNYARNTECKISKQFVVNPVFLNESARTHYNGITTRPQLSGFNSVLQGQSAIENLAEASRVALRTARTYMLLPFWQWNTARMNTFSKNFGVSIPPATYQTTPIYRFGSHFRPISFSYFPASSFLSRSSSRLSAGASQLEVLLEMLSGNDLSDEM